MRRLKTEVAIIGSGATAMLAANRLIGGGTDVVLINPSAEFGIEDLRPTTGLGLWNAAYRAESPTSLADFYDELVGRLREAFPATVEQSGLRKGEYLSVLSSTPIHRSVTDELEREFFRLERKNWSSGQFRLVNPEHALTRARRFGLDLPAVAQVEGGVMRAYGLWWDAARMGYYLSHFIHNKFFAGHGGSSRCFKGVDIGGRYGRKIVVETSEGEEVSVECDRGIYIFLTGELLPHIKSIVAACDEPWIQGVRKRRREQHFAWFDRPEAHWPPTQHNVVDEPVWVELGHTRYRWCRAGGTATWAAVKGPDALERVVDEGLRLHSLPRAATRFTRSERAFKLEWDWKSPQWRETSHQTYWATSFEGDLWNIMELLWNLPRH